MTGSPIPRFILAMGCCDESNDLLKGKTVSYQSIDLAIDDGLVRLTLNQPERGNPIDGQLCSELAQVADDLAERDDVRAILLRSNGKLFSVGGDIQMFSRNLEQLPRMIREWTAGLHVGIARLARLDAPIVASVHATAMGGSVALIAHCDLVFAARSARFGAAYTQIGYSCDMGASYALASRMGVARARRFLLMNEMLEAADAANAGLVDYVADDGAVAAAAEETARKLSRGPTRAYGEIRRLMSRALGDPLEAVLENEAQGLARAAGTTDANEGITAFVQKRKPQFKGQ